jgi:hypothetical protein
MLHQPCTLLRSPPYLPLKVQGASPYTMGTICLQLLSQSPDAGVYAQFGCRVMSVRAEQGERQQQGALCSRVCWHTVPMHTLPG